MDIVEEEVNWSIKAKYLGVILGQGLTLKDHVDYLVDMTKKSMGKLIGRRSKLELKIKLRLIRAILNPIMLYTCTQSA